MEYSLLDDPLFRVRDGDGAVKDVTLPDVLVGLVAGDILSFERLQVHQQQAWHCFLVQTAAMTVVRERGGDVPEEADAWREGLVSLAGGDAAWCLVVDDPTAPAFMQPPVPEGSLDKANFKSDVPTPDQLDVLITSKNHDVKSQRIHDPEPEHWIHALIMLQTMEGFLGRGNYGIVRMNGGFGNRPLLSISPDLSWGTRFRRDLNLLLDQRDTFEGRYTLTGVALLWTKPWDGAKKSGIPLGDLDPYFVEVCRRIRFARDAGSGELTCWRANTKAQRINADDDLNGITGDVWTPIDTDDNKALTLGAGGFTYTRMQQILFEHGYDRPPALELRESESGGAHVVAQALVRGQGKTDGLHRRTIPISKQAVSWFNSDTDRRKLGRRSQMRVDKAAEVRRRVLFPAISALLTGRPDERPDNDRVSPWLDAFDDRIDARFFDALWTSVELDEQEAQRQWEAVLRTEAEHVFERAQGHAPKTITRYWRARSTAQSLFYAAVRETLKTTVNATPDDAETESRSDSSDRPDDS